METRDIQQLQEQVREGAAPLQLVKAEMGRIISGQSELIDRMLLALITDGHILLEGVPGLAKTLAVKTLAQTLDGSFSRLQFTPDLLPADLTGTRIYNAATGDFSHAIAYGMKLAKTMGKGSVLINISGRGDKDMDYIIEKYGIR